MSKHPVTDYLNFVSLLLVRLYEQNANFKMIGVYNDLFSYIDHFKKKEFSALRASIFTGIEWNRTPEPSFWKEALEYPFFARGLPKNLKKSSLFTIINLQTRLWEPILSDK